MKKKKYLKKVGVPMKKRVVGHRVISFLLCVLMLFGTVPLISFAAIDPIMPDVDTTYPVLDRSAEDITLYKSIKPIAEQEQILVDSRLGDFTFNKVGVRICKVRENGTIATNYLATKLSVEFVNKEGTAKERMLSPLSFM